ncbi:hypothetical protein FB451DRAFT_1512596 [Mycena latifolia]|nr:hypothetical protein FB451DRAFT_1512596 [Mycena latifolia]
MLYILLLLYIILLLLSLIYVGLLQPRLNLMNVHGGTGGTGGKGGEQGGAGGTGEGVIVNAGPGIIVINHGNKEEGMDASRLAFLDWFSPINFFLRHADISRVRAKGTGEWLRKHPLFIQWESGSESTLWCHGIRISMVVDHLSAASRNNKDIGVACIYLNHKEADQQPPPKLLAGVWRQLVLDRDIGSTAEDLYKQHWEKGTVPSLEEVVNVLSSSLKQFSQVFIIVDAMDEYPEFQRKILLQQLAAMGSNVNLMITSRPNISPESLSFPNLVTLDIQAAPEDIQAYINAQIELSPRLSKHTQMKPLLREEILTKIIDTVAGMFLLARLHIESLNKEATIKAVREALKHLPKGLNATYESAMKRIEDQGDKNKQIAYSTLTWVVNAKRPLTVSEIQTALAVEPDSRELDEDNVMDINIILSVCAGLVIVDKESSVVRLVHYTTQEYLDSIQALQFPDAQIEITRTLLTFLAFDGYPDSSWKSGNLSPLVKYSQYCLAHAAGQPEVQLRDNLLNFCNQAFQWKQTLAPRWFSWDKWKSLPWNYPDWPSKPSALWIAAAANLVETTKFLLEGAPLLRHSNNSEIIVASHYGHTEIVGILLEKGANINAAGGGYESSLQAAAAGGHTEIVGLLLEKGADVNAAGGRYGSSLQAAAAEGHTDIVGILLERGADVNAAGGKYSTALEIASRCGHNKIVSMLLERGARFPVPVENERDAQYASSLDM